MQDTVRTCDANSVAPSTGSELAIDLSQIPLHCAFSEPEFVTDFPVECALGNPVENFQLASSERYRTARCMDKR